MEIPEWNQLEQVSNDDHQMSVPGGGVGPMGGERVDPRSDVLEEGVGPESDVQRGGGTLSCDLSHDV